jgi:hypothetical protein
VAGRAREAWGGPRSRAAQGRALRGANRIARLHAELDLRCGELPRTLRSILPGGHAVGDLEGSDARGEVARGAGAGKGGQKRRFPGAGVGGGAHHVNVFFPWMTEHEPGCSGGTGTRSIGLGGELLEVHNCLRPILLVGGCVPGRARCA